MTLDELSTYASQNEHLTSKVQVGRLAARQRGRITRAQLRTLRVSPGTIARWVSSGYLLPVLPRVYAVGHLSEDEPARLFSLILFAGPGAALSHGAAAHHRGWLRYRVRATHISTPRRIRARFPGVVFHCQRDIDRELVDGVPCTTVTQTLLDLAATESPKLVNRSLAQLDYERRLDRQAICDACGRGRPGSARLLTALDSYMPELARTKSDLEEEFLYLCRRAGIDLPLVNTHVHGIEVDCRWPDLNLVVELDGGRAHGTGPQRTRDRRRELKLRGHGIPMIRYSEDQVFHDPDHVVGDLLAEIARRRSGLTYPG